jgi:hypothetical protein
MTGDSLKQPNFRASFGIEVAPFDTNLVAMNVQPDPVGWAGPGIHLTENILVTMIDSARQTR